MIFTQSRQGYRYNIDTFLLFDFASSLNFKGCVLDVGCGCGIVGILLKEHFPKISLFLLDIMSENCDLARRNLVQNGIEAEVICADFAEFARLKNGKNFTSENINFIGKKSENLKNPNANFTNQKSENLKNLNANFTNQKSENLKNLNANFTNQKSENLNFLSKNSKNLNSLCGENSINLNSISDNFIGEKIMKFRDENANFIKQKDEKFINKNANFLNLSTTNSMPNSTPAKNDKNAKFPNLNEQKFDFIVSNPPFYRQGALQSPNEFVKRGKSSHSLKLESFVNASSALLKPNGTLCFCYEVGALQELCAHLSAAKLKITRLKFVHKNATQRARLALIAAKKGAKSPCELQNPLFVYENGELSAKMQEIYTKIRVRSADL